MGDSENPGQAETLPTASSEPARVPQEPPKQAPISPPQRITIGLSALALLVSIVSIVFQRYDSWANSVAAQKAAVQQAKDLREQRAAADRSAAAAERSAMVAEDSLRAQLSSQRPRFSAIATNFQAPRVGVAPSADVYIQSHGNTAGITVALNAWIELLDGVPKRLPHPESHLQQEAKASAGSHIMQSVAFPRPLTQAEVGALASGKKTLFIYGDIRYTDDGSTNRTQEWCAYFQPGRADTSILPSCPIHNGER